MSDRDQVFFEPGDSGPDADHLDVVAPDESYPLATPQSIIAWEERCKLSRRQFWTVRQQSNWMPEDDLVASLTNEIVRTELAAGTLMIRSVPEHDAVLVEGHRHRVMRISERSEALLGYLLYRYRLNGKDALTKAIISNLRSMILEKGWPRESRRFAVYDMERQVLYLSRYNGWAWALDGRGADIVPNGERVFFLDDDGGREWGGVRRAPLIANHGRLLATLSNLHCADETPGGMRPLDQRRAFLAWSFATAFHDLLPTKPFLLVEGPPGSGKTSAVSILQRIVHGRDRVMQVAENREDDFAIQLVRSPIAMFDNVDSYVKWIPNAICSYVTKGEWVRRRLYHDTEEQVIRPHAFVAVTSMNPSSFRRSDIVDRIVVLRLARRPKFTPLSAIQRDIDQDIERLYGEWLYWLGRIVARLRERGGLSADGQYRMADFSAFALVVGEALGWSDADVDAMLTGLQRERDAFAAETDDVVDLLETWARIPSNVGRPVDADELLRSLNLIADAMNRQPIKGVSMLIQRLRSPHLLARYDIEISARGGAWTYAIRQKTQGVN
jgi:hypothetical protein